MRPDQQKKSVIKCLTHWGWVTHIYISNLTIIGSDNDLLPGWHKAIIWTNAGIMLVGPLGTKIQWNFNRNSWIFIQEKAFENGICDTAAISSQPQYGNICLLIKSVFHCNFASRFFHVDIDMSSYISNNPWKLYHSYLWACWGLSTLIPAWISNHMPGKVCDEITPLSCTVEV